MTCSTCSGPSDNGTPRCSWCTDIDQVTAKRDAALAEHERYVRQIASNSRASDVSTLWTIRIAIAVAVLAIRACAAMGH